MSIRIPAEWEAHECCWMAWAVHREWGAAARQVKRELGTVVRAVARYERVRLLAPPGAAAREARREFARGPNVDVKEAAVDDIWMRDIAPTFALRRRGKRREVVGIDWNFNAWGRPPTRPPRPGDRLAATATFGVPRIRASFVAEGGAFVTDGRGTFVTTKSCLLNPNRNPPQVDSRHAIERDLRRFGARKLIWLEGDPDEPLTSGHVDGYVMPAPAGVVLVEDDEQAVLPMRRYDVATLKRVSTGGGRMTVRNVKPPRPRFVAGAPASFAASYLNAYVANGAVVAARFGDPERDALAESALKRAFPKRDVLMLRIDTIAAGGGGIHCLTQPMPVLMNDIARGRRRK